MELAIMCDNTSIIIIFLILLLNPFCALAETSQLHSVDIDGIKLNFSLPNKYIIDEKRYPTVSENNSSGSFLTKALDMKLQGYSKTFYIAVIIPNDFDENFALMELGQSMNSIAADENNAYGEFKKNESIEIDDSSGIEAFFQGCLIGPDGNSIENYIIMYWKHFNEDRTPNLERAKIKIIAEVDSASEDELKDTLKSDFSGWNGIY